MRHALIHPAFPDIVGQWAAEAIDDRVREGELDPSIPAILSEMSPIEQIVDALVIAAAERDIAETRAW